MTERNRSRSSPRQCRPGPARAKPISSKTNGRQRCEAGGGSIRLLGIDPGDVAAPARPVILDQLGRRGAPGAGDREQRVEEMRLVLAAEIAARPPVQRLAGDV